MLSNHLSSHPDALLASQSQPAINSVLAVPLKHRGRTIGAMALANKKSGYDLFDQEGIESLATVLVETLVRKRAETAERETQNLLQATLDSTTDGILAVDADNHDTHFNAQFAQMWRIPEDLLATADDDRMLAYVRDQVEEPEAFLAKIRQLQASDEKSFDTIRGGGGSKTVASSNGSPVP